MSANEKIARLEELLARVQERASAPRANGGGAAFVAAPQGAPIAEPPRPISSFPPETTADLRADEDDVDVEVSTEMVDIDVDVDEMGMPLESGAQPVAAQSPLADEGATEDSAPAQAAANEIQEPAPSSSPRPIASDKPEAFEDESAPRHTPPPESGKQVASPSVSPASLEGHTLIGGWREPGLAREAGATGPPVRVPAPPAGASLEPITAKRASVVPEVTRTELQGQSAEVATFEGEAPSFKPSTFGELIDATLAL